MSAGDAELQSKLEQLLSREIAGFQTLQSCQQLTAGASQQTYKLALETEHGTQQLALRRSQPGIDSETGIGGVSLETEARLFQLSAAAEVPGPAIVYVLKPRDGLGGGFLMTWLEGETLGQRIVRSRELEAVRPTLARACGAILGRIHSLDWQAAGLEADLPVVDPASLVQETWELYRALEVPVPMIDYCWRWLAENLPEEHSQALVHGDFRNGNLMVTPEGINAVLDWELAHIGDPLRDLGWLCVNSWRFGKSSLAVGGFGDIDELLAGYQQTSGRQVSRMQLQFWQVFGSFWWSVVTLQMASTWRSGETPSLERPVIGRRSSEAQMDCVNLLIPGPFTLPDPNAALELGSQLPMPAELLSGVVDFLNEDVATKLDSHSAFLARVAANSLQIAQRELVHGSALNNAEQARLEKLLGQRADLDELRRELVSRLRDGLSLDTPGLAEHLRASVAGQLAIDQPGYSALAP